MSWIHVPLTLNCSLEPEAASSLECSSAGEPFVPLKIIPTASESSSSGSRTESSSRSPCGMTREHSTGDPGADAWISSLPAGRVRQSVVPAKGKASTMSDGSGLKLLGSFARLGRDCSSGKMCLVSSQPMMDGSSTKFSRTWPKAATMLAGRCSVLQRLALLTSDDGCGFWLPTPTAVDSGSYFNQSDSPNAALRPTLGAMAKHDLWPTPCGPNNGGTRGKAKLKRMLFPTPMNADGIRASKTFGRGNLTLLGAVKMFPTPTSSMMTWGDMEQARFSGETRPDYASLKFPTPAARDYRSPNKNGNMPDQPPNVVGGLLNPEWVEWLMNWPIGHTESAQSETAKSLCARRRRFCSWLEMNSRCLRGPLMPALPP